MNVKKLSVTTLALLVGWTVVSVNGPASAASTHEDKAKVASTPNATDHEYPYLGVAIESLHPSLASHLPDVLIKGQGVLVGYVTDDSPAAKAGITSDDILVRYGDQKLFSTEQLAKLVISDTPGHEVPIELVRGGKLQTVNVTLGVHHEAVSANSPTHHWWNDFFHHRTVAPRTENQTATKNWDSFDSMTLKRLDDGQFQAEIKYLDTEGKLESHVFTGTRQEIEQAVKKEKDLPAGERDHVLNAIENPQHAMMTPAFPFGPDDFDFYWQPLLRDF